MRLFYAALALETNTFLPIPTSYQAFVEKIYYPPGKHPEKSGHQTGAIAAARAAAKRHGFELIEGSCYAAQPGGAASREAYERMRDSDRRRSNSRFSSAEDVLASFVSALRFIDSSCSR